MLLSVLFEKCCKNVLNPDIFCRRSEKYPQTFVQRPSSGPQNRWRCWQLQWTLKMGTKIVGSWVWQVSLSFYLFCSWSQFRLPKISRKVKQGCQEMTSFKKNILKYDSDVFHNQGMIELRNKEEKMRFFFQVFVENFN